MEYCFLLGIWGFGGEEGVGMILVCGDFFGGLGRGGRKERFWFGVCLFFIFLMLFRFLGVGLVFKRCGF